MFRACLNTHTLTFDNPHDLLEDLGSLPKWGLIVEVLCSTVFPALQSLILRGDIDLARLVVQLGRRAHAFEKEGLAMQRLQLSLPADAYNQDSAEDIEALRALGELADVVLREAKGRM